MSLREAAQQALKAMTGAVDELPHAGYLNDAIIALRTALAIPGNDYERGFVDGMSHQAKSSVDRAVNAMAQRKPLTDEELKPIADQYEIVFGGWVIDFARAIERAHGIGEQT